MATKRVGRPSKIDKDTMYTANVMFVIVIIILLLLLSVAALSIISPDVYDALKANLIKFFK